MNFEFIPSKFIEYLPYMGNGMLTILIVMAVLIGITAFLNYVTKKKK